MTDKKVSGRLINHMVANGFLKRQDKGNQEAVAKAAAGFLNYMLEVDAEETGMPRWRVEPNFGAKTFEELRELAGAKLADPLTYVSVWVPSSCEDELRLIAERMCKRGMNERGTESSSGGETGAG